MVPFFSRRSILILLLGLIVGGLLGLGYWHISPINAEAEMGWPPIHFNSPPDLYESTVTLELMPPGSYYRSVKSLQYEGEYYAAKMGTSSFLEFFSHEVEVLAPRYSHTLQELEEMMRVRYEYSSDNPLVSVRMTSPSEGEAFFLAGIAPQVFQDYLTAEERDLQQKEYQYVKARFGSVSADLVEARNELADLATQTGVDGLVDADLLELDVAYVMTDARVRALQRELDTLSAQLVSLSTADPVEPEVLGRLIIGDPSAPTLVPPDKIRGRNALIMGAVFGVGFAWVGLNFKGLSRYARPSPATTPRLKEKEEDEEGTEEQGKET